MPKTRKLTLMAILSTIALIIFVIEAQIPAPVPVPGVKLGLANIITLVAMVVLGRKEAGAVLSLMSGSGSAVFGLFESETAAQKGVEQAKRYTEQVYLV